MSWNLDKLMDPKQIDQIREINKDFQNHPEREIDAENMNRPDLNEWAKEKITSPPWEKVKKKTRNVGQGFRIPQEALEKDYRDKNCPFTGNISIRGRLIRGKVVSTKMNRTIIVRRDYLHWIPKYKRFEKRHKNIPSHCSPCFRVQEGDFVTIGQCRPISKTIRFNVIQMNKKINKREKKNSKNNIH
ncbi:40S ribosomal protein S11 (nucleomorph) [Chroomonas mesostigmatica CCMP1168]|uniref:Small ribosomal subunit protein uS17 n=1 Tax=Chroomonas mesostigmatica CCMP1168 TaxID=1195612 RepID=J7GA99_9CRYP|nr:40S ribosomal protein S11 [Chroomonas mesostigmatica CCMP1168]|mmetsp:Transcript_52742/g.128819  ORF Transcript_52742/g.128819 Transcript_52742/m.128819 type:complete len:187 (-) Transcript_52742:701-1261(-)